MTFPAIPSREWFLQDLLRMYNPQKKPYFPPGMKRVGVWQDPFYPIGELCDIFRLREEHYMAKGRTRNRNNKAGGDYTFVRLTLTAEEKAAAKKFAAKPAEELDVLVRDVLASGHKISFSYNETNDSVTCTFTGKPEESVNEYRMLTSFSPSWFQSLAINLFKFDIIFKQGVWEGDEGEDDFG